MTSLITKPNIGRPDEIYQDLIRAHEGLTKDESDALNARLILVLLNQIGDDEIIRQAISLAQSAARPKREDNLSA